MTLPAAVPVPTGMEVYKRLLTYARPYWRVFAGSALAMLFYAATDTGFAALMKPLLDGSFVRKDPFLIQLMPWLLLALFLVRGISGFLSAYGMSWVGRRIIGTLRGQMFEQLLRLPARFYATHARGVLISKFTYNVEQVSQAATSAVNILIKDVLTVVGLLAWMIYLSGPLALLFVVMGPLIAALTLYINRRFRRISSAIQDSMGEVTRVVEQSIAGQDVIKSYGAQEAEASYFSKVNQRNMQFNLKLAATSAASIQVIQWIAACALAAIIYFATRGALLESITVGTFISFMTAMLLMLPPLKRITTVNSVLQRGIVAADSSFALLDSTPERDTGTRTLQRARGSVHFQGVSFAYEAGQANAIEHVSFTLEPGMRLALVGRSGSGKTTLANFVPRFFDPDSGAVLLDGIDVRTYRLADLRAQIALVSQHVTLFNDSIARNIAYGRPGVATPEAIMAAAAAAHVLEFAELLPRGMDTPIGEGGAALSGGQRQRIAIARALIKDAPILILDEATSALDNTSELKVQAALERLMRTRTTLVIAHRLATVEKADKIIVLDRGRVVESGRHNQLLAQGGYYASLYHQQSATDSGGATVDASPGLVREG